MGNDVSSPDISTLFKSMDINDFNYREIRQEELTREARERWPLLKVIHLEETPGGESPPPASEIKEVGGQKRIQILEDFAEKQPESFPAWISDLASPTEPLKTRLEMQQSSMKRTGQSPAGGRETESKGFLDRLFKEEIRRPEDHPPETLYSHLAVDDAKALPVSRLQRSDQSNSGKDFAATSNNEPKTREAAEASPGQRLPDGKRTDLRVLFERLCREDVSRSERQCRETAQAESTSLSDLFNKLAKKPQL